MNTPLLPQSVRVIQRGWLNCNQVVLLEGGNNVLIDSGYCTHREQTLERLAGPEGLDGKPLERLINTHCHSDHMGGNAAVAHATGCTITIPEGEAKHVVPWTEQSVWMKRFDQRADPFHFDATLAAGDTFEAAGFEWQAIAAPGHDMDALMYFEPRNRILVSGDALWENGMGFVWPEHAGPHIAAAQETLSRIEALDPATVIPGHGAPFHDAKGSIASVRSKLEAFARDPAKNARHVVKVLFVFALLDKQSMHVDDIADYVGTCACYRELSDRFLGLDNAALAQWLVADLERAGAISSAKGVIRPTMSA
ncbi:MBL fold metallo-hydrolase [Usitatibacter palustris]|uniref:beta-lactamase n=1 Tax=Usitatibacter palustris TaxID=2732487 RepID=A0A6M4H6J2_9PROT|nr:MBL fold metallo-hydrolase [Usitatibacter palustris]QJR14972.1 Hydroxyacylglutathione hydrolase [Usitatibacter palustris]